MNTVAQSITNSQDNALIPDEGFRAFIRGMDLFDAHQPLTACADRDERAGWKAAERSSANSETLGWLSEHSIEDDAAFVRSLGR